MKCITLSVFCCCVFTFVRWTKSQVLAIDFSLTNIISLCCFFPLFPNAAYFNTGIQTFLISMSLTPQRKSQKRIEQRQSLDVRRDFPAPNNLLDHPKAATSRNASFHHPQFFFILSSDNIHTIQQFPQHRRISSDPQKITKPNSPYHKTIYLTTALFFHNQQIITPNHLFPIDKYIFTFHQFYYRLLKSSNKQWYPPQ